MSINDEWVRYLRASGYTGSINDMIRADLQAQTGSSSKHPNTLWVEYLTGQGYSGQLNDMMYQWLGSKGYTGSLNDRWMAALKADDVFAAPSPTLVYDSFTEASLTSIVDHTPDTVAAPASGGYSQNGAYFRVGPSGYLESMSNLGSKVCWINSGVSDGIFSLDSVPETSGLAFRVTDANNCWFAYNTDATRVDLYERTASAYISRGTYSTGVRSAHKLQVILSGPSIKVYIDGTLRIAISSSVRETVTNFGVYADSGVTIGTSAGDNLYAINSTDGGLLP